MQIQQKNVKGLKQEFEVSIAAQKIEKKIDEKLAELAKTKKIPGFRPGKTPLSIMRQRFDDEIRGDTLEIFVREFIKEVTQKYKITIAGSPKFNIKKYNKGEDLNFSAEVEIFPDFELKEISKYSFERLKVEIQDTEIDDYINNLQKINLKTQKISDSRALKEEDFAIVDIEAFEDDKSLEFLKTEKEKIYLKKEKDTDEPAKSLFKAMLGKKAGENVSVIIAMPKSHPHPKLAGREIRYEVGIQEIHEKIDVPIDDEFAKEYGLDSVEKLREEIKRTLQDNNEKESFFHMRRQVLDKIAEEYTFEVPETVVEKEFEIISKQIEEEANKDNSKEKLSEKEVKDQKEKLHKIAERRVRLALILAKIGEEYDIKVIAREIEKAVANEAMKHPGREKEVFQHIIGNHQILEQIRAPILEEKVIRHIVDQSNVKEKIVSSKKLQEEVEKLVKDD